jgi:hypothetical protein
MPNDPMKLTANELMALRRDIDDLKRELMHVRENAITKGEIYKFVMTLCVTLIGAIIVAFFHQLVK